VWYGFLTLGRWMGCFADFGWAWNVKPDDVANAPTATIVSMPVDEPSAHSRRHGGVRRRWSKAAVPSAEFVESFVIFLYGASNVFLEHLAAWGKAWTARDLEHVSISVMFFGGGLVSLQSVFYVSFSFLSFCRCCCCCGCDCGCGCAGGCTLTITPQCDAKLLAWL
jgi:hypothetical protein